MISCVRYWSVGLGFLYFVSGCAGVGGAEANSGSAESIVAKKAQMRWDALVKGDMAGVYNYLSPATRSTVSLLVYSRQYRLGLWHSATVDKVVCELDRCKVAVKLSLKSGRGDVPIETYSNELWIKDASEWWFVWK